MDEYLCAHVHSQPGETEAAFKSRLSAFWSFMLRQHEATFEKVYAETTRFPTTDGRLARQYLIEAGIADQLAGLFREHGIDCNPIDADEVYSKFEAAPPDWFQLEH